MNLSSSGPSTSISLLQRASDGDGDAWRHMVRLYGPIVYRWARHGGLSATDAADVVQDAFMALAKQLRQFDPLAAGSTFRGWLWTITRNKAIDLVRRQSRSPRAIGGDTALRALGELADQVPSAIELTASFSAAEPPSSSAADRRLVLRRLLAMLRSRYDESTWSAFWMTAVEGKSPDEVAEALQLNRWSVYKAKSRVLHRLRTELEGLEPLD